MKFLKPFTKGCRGPNADTPETREEFIEVAELLDNADPAKLLRFFIGYCGADDKTAVTLLRIIIDALMQIKGVEALDTVIIMCERSKKKYFAADEEKKKRWKEYGDLL